MMEINDHTIIKSSIWGSLFTGFFGLLNAIIQGKEDQKCWRKERWRIADLAIIVDVTGHLNNVNKELQRKYKLIIEMDDNIKPSSKFHIFPARTNKVCNLDAQ